jgi:hypothetical protein
MSKIKNMVQPTEIGQPSISESGEVNTESVKTAEVNTTGVHTAGVHTAGVHTDPGTTGINSNITFDELHAPKFNVSKAAELANMHPQTLREYDRIGLVVPSRTAGKSRRYSFYDIYKLQQIQHLSSAEGINLAGISRIMSLEEEVRILRMQLAALDESSVFTVDMSGQADLAKGHTGLRPHGFRNFKNRVLKQISL